MDILIYQVLGKLSGYSNVSYEINGFIEKDVKLSSEALYSFHAKNNHNPKIVYVCPNSLYTKQNIREYLTNPVLLEKELHDEISSISVYEDFDILVINAIGNYKIGGEEVSFENTPGNVSIRLFLDMLERVKKYDGKVKLIADISTGHNIYIAAMLEALRAIIVYDKLRNGITGKKVDAAYAIAEPVGPNSESPRRIFVNEYDVKAFFTLPIKTQNLDSISKLEYYVERSDTKQKIRCETEDERRRLKNLLENLVKAFNSIKYNVPLALYTSAIDFSQDADILERKLIDFLLKVTKPVFNENRVAVTSLKWKDLFNLFYSLALFKWMSNEMGDLKEKDRASITELKKKTIQIYSKLGLLLNKRFLERDLSEIYDKKDRIPEEWACLKNLYPEEGMQGPLSVSDSKRNFFAHSGLERTMVEVRKYKEEIELRYMQEQLDLISKWLFNPED
ncbi:MAG: CRISPR-associated CARF protein Csx1 [Thermofilum sp.]|uniref:CRISPR-associated CARF protein Csx1 n=1 Tax=Thermofilum sp. TaxID=1961369 RepID=UPI00316BDB42